MNTIDQFMAPINHTLPYDLVASAVILAAFQVPFALVLGLISVVMFYGKYVNGNTVNV